MDCVSSGTFSILINGVPKGHIVPSRGLRQGDPLSPYLFLLCTDGLICLLSKASLKGQISGIKVCKGAPSINHLLFADNNIIFYKASVDTTKQVQLLLSNYEAALGQFVNAKKANMVF